MCHWLPWDLDASHCLNSNYSFMEDSFEITSQRISLNTRVLFKILPIWPYVSALFMTLFGLMWPYLAWARPSSARADSMIWNFAKHGLEKLLIIYSTTKVHPRLNPNSPWPAVVGGQWNLKNHWISPSRFDLCDVGYVVFVTLKSSEYWLR